MSDTSDVRTYTARLVTTDRGVVATCDEIGVSAHGATPEAAMAALAAAMSERLQATVTPVARARRAAPGSVDRPARAAPLPRIVRRAHEQQRDTEVETPVHRATEQRRVAASGSRSVARAIEEARRTLATDLAAEVEAATELAAIAVAERALDHVLEVCTALLADDDLWAMLAGGEDVVLPLPQALRLQLFDTADVAALLEQTGYAVPPPPTADRLVGDLRRAIERAAEPGAAQRARQQLFAFKYRVTRLRAVPTPQRTASWRVESRRERAAFGRALPALLAAVATEVAFDPSAGRAGVHGAKAVVEYAATRLAERALGRGAVADPAEVARADRADAADVLEAVAVALDPTTGDAGHRARRLLTVASVALHDAELAAASGRPDRVALAAVEQARRHLGAAMDACRHLDPGARPDRVRWWRELVTADALAAAQALRSIGAGQI